MIVKVYLIRFRFRLTKDVDSLCSRLEVQQSTTPDNEDVDILQKALNVYGYVSNVDPSIIDDAEQRNQLIITLFELKQSIETESSDEQLEQMLYNDVAEERNKYSRRALSLQIDTSIPHDLTEMQCEDKELHTDLINQFQE